VLAAVVALIGCGRPQVQTEDRETRLGDDCPIDLAAWLTKTRPELAKLADECEALIDTQREGLRNLSTDGQLLPRLAAPRTAAVSRGATHAAPPGAGPPPSATRAPPAPAVAAHFAHSGAHAAVKFAGDAPDARRAVEALRTKKDSPADPPTTTCGRCG